MDLKLSYGSLILVLSSIFLFGSQQISAETANSYSQSGGEVHYNWGSGSPKVGVPSDNFTALFDQSKDFTPGDYFIQTLADDGVKVEADGKWLINRWSASDGKIDRSLWLGVTGGQHTVKTHYLEDKGTAAVFSDIVPLDSWIAYYYPNKDIKGAPVAGKVLSPSGPLKKLTEDHGLNSPSPGKIPVDQFSAKYTSAKRLAAGEYILRARADDGIRVYVDGKLVLNRWMANDYKNEDAVKINIADRAGAATNEKNVHWVEVEYYDGSGASRLDVHIEPYQEALNDGEWIGEIYPNLTLSGNPVILGGKNSAQRITDLNFNWGSKSPNSMIPVDKYSARFRKKVQLEAGNYTFEAKSDDGIRILVDGKPVLNYWRSNDAKTILKGTISLPAGLHEISVEYYENLGNSSLSINYYNENNKEFEQIGGEVHYNWGSGSPKAGVPSDNFTALFDQSKDFTPGDYFVQTLADDGVKVEADGKWLINRWSASDGKIDRSLWLGVTGGQHTVKTHYLEDKGTAAVFSDIVPLDSWIAYYYPNKDIKGAPVAGKVLSPNGPLKKLTEDHGLNSPSPGKIPVDQFSAKYTSAKRLAAGEYILRARADDGIRVYVDGKLVLNRWMANDYKNEDAVKINIADRAGAATNEKNVHWVEVEYYDGSGASRLDVHIEPYQEALNDGEWIGEIYPNLTLSGNPVILGGKNSAQRITELNFNWGSKSPNSMIPVDKYSARFRKKVQLEAGTYYFKAIADDGVRVIVDGKTVIDSWMNSGGNIRDGSINLSEGIHDITVEYFENTGLSLLKLDYQKASTHFEQSGGEIHYNWGKGSPSPAILSDNFTALFNQSKQMSQGDYYIQTLADDGIRVDVNGKSLINRWSDANGQIDRALWLGVQSGYQDIKINYYEKIGDAAIFSDINPLGTWTAYYYPNTSLSGLPAAANTIDSAGNTLKFSENHGTGSPAAGKINNDGFSSRYSTAARITAGDYVIRTRADDGVRVLIDGKIVLDRWTSGSSKEDAMLVTIGDKTNVADNEKDIHWIEVQYYENMGASNLDFFIEPVDASYHNETWVGYIYPNKNLSGNAVVIGGKNSQTPINNLNLNWGKNSPSSLIPNDGFSARFKKRAYFKNGDYKIDAHFDDGAKLFIDGKEIINEWYNTGSYGTTKTAAITLTEGYHEIVVEYFENIGDSYLTFSFEENIVYRVPDRPAPYGPDFYEVKNGILYHYLGSPGNTTATINIGPAPVFLTSGKIYVKDALDKFYERTSYSDYYVGTYLPPFKGLDLRTASNISAQEIDSYIRSIVPDSPLIGYGQSYLEAQQKYGVNAHYLVSHSLVESNWGRSNIAKYKHNLFGFGAYDSCPLECAYYFPTFKESIDYTAYYIRTNYLDSSGKWYGGSPTLKGMNVRYATDMDWAEKIAGLMQRMKAYKASDYTNLNPLPITADPPPTPGRDIPGEENKFTVYPVNIKGITTARVNFRKEASTSSQIIRTVDANLPLVVLGTDNLGWYKVQIGSEQGWISDDYVKIFNLLKTKVTGTLNIRKDANTSSEIVGTLTNGTLVEGIVDDQNQLITSGVSPGIWYKIKIPSTNFTGWVSSGYMERIDNN